MEKFYQCGSHDTPEVLFDGQKGMLFMGGSSLPENVLEVFNPILQWVNEYKSQVQNTTRVEFNFEYLNTSSTKMVSKLIESLQELEQKGNIQITWYYSSGDRDMKELGTDLLEETSCSFRIIELAA